MKPLVKSLQGSPKECFPGLVNFVTAVAYLVSRVSSVKQSVKILNPAILSVTRLYSVSYSVTKIGMGAAAAAVA